MFNMVMGSLLIVGYLVLFWILGATLPAKFQSRSIPVMCITGFLLYYAVFQIVALPMKIMQLPLKTLSFTWIGILGAFTLYALVGKHKVLMDSIKGIFVSPKKLQWIGLFALVTLALGIVLGANTNTISDYDACYYIGLPVSSVYSNTLEMMSPYSGVYMKAPQHFYLLNTDTLNSAVIYQVLNLHPLVERKWTFTITMVILFEMCLYLCGKFFFKEDQRKTAMLLLFSNLILMFSYSLAGVSHYFAYRTYEGKAITSYFYTTVIFCFCLAIYKVKENKWAWAALFLMSVSAVAFSNTAIFVVPCMLVVTLVPQILYQGMVHKKWNMIGNLVIVLLPCIFWMILHEVL